MFTQYLGQHISTYKPLTHLIQLYFAIAQMLEYITEEHLHTRSSS